MKNMIVYGVFLGFLLIGCQTHISNSKKPEVKEQEKPETPDLINTAPHFTYTTDPNEIRQACESVISMINRALPELKKVEKKVMFEGVPNTPITIWYSDTDLPVKIECAVTDDSGGFKGDFIQYYFINGQLWYSDHYFARYLFDSDKLQFWMDENWRINEIPAKDFKDREMILKSDVENFLSKNK